MVVDPNDYSYVISEYSVENARGIIAVQQVNENFLKHKFKHKRILYDNGEVTPVRKWRNIEAYNHDGGSVSVSAFKLAVRYNARSVALLGQDLVLTSGQYYIGDKDFSKIVRENGKVFFPSENQSNLEVNNEFLLIDGQKKPAFYLKGIDGKQHVTKGDYFFFHRQFVYSARDISRHKKEVSLLNCTSAGAFLEGFEHITLSKHHANVLVTKEEQSSKYLKEKNSSIGARISNCEENVQVWLTELKSEIGKLRAESKSFKKLLENLDVNDKRWSSYFLTLKTVSDKYPILNAIAGDTTNALNKRVSVVQDNDTLLFELDLFAEEIKNHCDYLWSFIDTMEAYDPTL